MRSMPGLFIALALPAAIVAHHTYQYGSSYWLRWGPGYWLFGWRHYETIQVGQFTLEYYVDRQDIAYTKLIVKPGDFVLETSSWHPRNKGEDINGDGIPDLLLSRSAGTDYVDYKMLSLEDQGVREIFTVMSLLMELQIQDSDGDGIWEYHAVTWTDGVPTYDEAGSLDYLIELSEIFED